MSGDRNHNRAWGLAHITDGFFENATNANIKWQQTVNYLSEEQLRDASEIVEHYTTTVYTDMIFDCDENRGLVQSTGCTNAPNSVAPQRNSIPSLRDLQTDTTNSIQIIKGNKQNNINNVDQIQEPTNTTRPTTKQTITAQTHVNNKCLQYTESLTYK